MQLRGITMFKKFILILGLVFLAITAQAGVIADTLYLEARGEGEKGIKAVATVIYNRAIVKHKSYKQICLQPKQFSCWNSGKVKITPKTKADKKAYEFCRELEEQMLSNKFKPMGNWTHYYNPKLCSPKWARGVKKTKIGNHVFLKVE